MAPVCACCPRYLASMRLGSQSLLTAPDARSLASFMKMRSPNSNESPAHVLPCSRSQGVLSWGPFLNLAIVSPAKSVSTSKSDHHVQAVVPACSPVQTSSLSPVPSTSSLSIRWHRLLGGLPLAILVKCSPPLLGPLLPHPSMPSTLVDEHSNSSLPNKACKEFHSVLRQAFLLQRCGNHPA